MRRRMLALARFGEKASAASDCSSSGRRAQLQRRAYSRPRGRRAPSGPTARARGPCRAGPAPPPACALVVSRPMRILVWQRGRMGRRRWRGQCAGSGPDRRGSCGRGSIRGGASRLQVSKQRQLINSIQNPSQNSPSPQKHKQGKNQTYHPNPRPKPPARIRPPSSNAPAPSPRQECAAASIACPAQGGGTACWGGT